VEQYDVVRETRSVNDNNFVRAGVGDPPRGSPDRCHGDPGVEHCLLKRLLAEAIEPVGTSAKWFGGTPTERCPRCWNVVMIALWVVPGTAAPLRVRLGRGTAPYSGAQVREAGRPVAALPKTAPSVPVK